jgi:hypothetical protein
MTLRVAPVASLFVRADRAARRRAGVLAIAALALTPAAAAQSRAHHRLILTGHDTQPYQGWIDASLVPVPHLRARFFGHATDCTCETDYPPVIYLSPGGVDPPFPDFDRLGLMHEVGHLFDDRMLSPADRLAFKRIDRQPDAPWHGPLGDAAGGDDPGTPQEDFANAYSICAVYGARVPDTAARALMLLLSNGDPDWAGQRRTCGLIRRAARARRAA